MNRPPPTSIPGPYRSEEETLRARFEQVSREHSELLEKLGYTRAKRIRFAAVMACVAVAVHLLVCSFLGVANYTPAHPWIGLGVFAVYIAVVIGCESF